MSWRSRRRPIRSAIVQSIRLLLDRSDDVVEALCHSIGNLILKECLPSGDSPLARKSCARWQRLQAPDLGLQELLCLEPGAWGLEPEAQATLFGSGYRRVRDLRARASRSTRPAASTARSKPCWAGSIASAVLAPYLSAIFRWGASESTYSTSEAPSARAFRRRRVQCCRERIRTRAPGQAARSARQGRDRQLTDTGKDRRRQLSFQLPRSRSQVTRLLTHRTTVDKLAGSRHNGPTHTATRYRHVFRFHPVCCLHQRGTSTLRMRPQWLSRRLRALCLMQ